MAINGKKLKPLYVRIDAELHDRVTAHAKELGRAVSVHVERILTQYFAKAK